LPAEKNAIGRDADGAADVAAHELVVAGEDLHRNAVRPERGDRRQRRFLRRIQERDVARQDQIAFIGLRVDGPLLEVAIGQRQHAKPIPAERIVLLAQIGQQHLVERVHLAIQLELCAALEQLFRRPLADQPVDALGGLHHDGHQTA
jgi:hypothetical protein